MAEHGGAVSECRFRQRLAGGACSAAVAEVGSWQLRFPRPQVPASTHLTRRAPHPGAAASRRSSR